MAGGCRELLVGACGVMADETVDVLLGGEIETVVLPSIADVAAGTARQITGDVEAKVVDDGFLAQNLAGVGICEFPVPVLGLVQLLARFSMATKAVLGNLRSCCKGLLKLLKFAVISGRCGGLGRCRFHRGKTQDWDACQGEQKYCREMRSAAVVVAERDHYFAHNCW